MGFNYQELKTTKQNSIILEKREDIEIKQTATGYSRSKKTFIRERFLCQPQNKTKVDSLQKKNSNKDLLKQKFPKKSTNQEQAKISFCKERKDKTTTYDQQHEFEKLLDEEKFLLGRERKDKKRHTNNTEPEATWAEQLTVNCKDVCVSTSSRYNDDRELTPRPRKRSVGLQMPDRKDSYGQGAEGDIKSYKKYTKTDLSNLTTSEQTINCCYSLMQHSPCTFSQPFKAVFCRCSNYQPSSVFINRECTSTYCQDDYYVDCTDCNPLCTSKCNPATSKCYKMRYQNVTQNTKLEAERDKNADQSFCSAKLSRRKYKDVLHKNSELAEFLENKKRELENQQKERVKKQMKNAEVQKTKQTTEKKLFKGEKLLKLLSKSESTELLKYFDQYIDEREKEVRPKTKQNFDDCTSKATTTSTTIKLKDDPTKFKQVTYSRHQGPPEVGKYFPKVADNESLASQYSMKTFRMLKKMKIREYKPQKPNNKMPQDKDETNRNKIKNYQQYIQKFSNEEERQMFIIKEPTKQKIKNFNNTEKIEKTLQNLDVKANMEEKLNFHTKEDRSQMEKLSYNKEVATTSTAIDFIIKSNQEEKRNLHAPEQPTQMEKIYNNEDISQYSKANDFTVEESREENINLRGQELQDIPTISNANENIEKELKYKDFERETLNDYQQQENFKEFNMEAKIELKSQNYQMNQHRVSGSDHYAETKVREEKFAYQKTTIYSDKTYDNFAADKYRNEEFPSEVRESEKETPQMQFSTEPKNESRFKEEHDPYDTNKTTYNQKSPKELETRPNSIPMRKECESKVKQHKEITGILRTVKNHTQFTAGHKNESRFKEQYDPYDIIKVTYDQQSAKEVEVGQNPIFETEVKEHKEAQFRAKHKNENRFKEQYEPKKELKPGQNSITKTLSAEIFTEILEPDPYDIETQNRPNSAVPLIYDSYSSKDIKQEQYMPSGTSTGENRFNEFCDVEHDPTLYLKFKLAQCQIVKNLKEIKSSKTFEQEPVSITCPKEPRSSEQTKHYEFIDLQVGNTRSDHGKFREFEREKYGNTKECKSFYDQGMSNEFVKQTYQNTEKLNDHCEPNEFEKDHCSSVSDCLREKCQVYKSSKVKQFNEHKNEKDLKNSISDKCIRQDFIRRKYLMTDHLKQVNVKEHPDNDHKITSEFKQRLFHIYENLKEKRLTDHQIPMASQRKRICSEITRQLLPRQYSVFNVLNATKLSEPQDYNDCSQYNDKINNIRDNKNNVKKFSQFQYALGEDNTKDQYENSREAKVKKEMERLREFANEKAKSVNNRIFAKINDTTKSKETYLRYEKEKEEIKEAYRCSRNKDETFRRPKAAEESAKFKAETQEEGVNNYDINNTELLPVLQKKVIQFYQPVAAASSKQIQLHETENLCGSKSWSKDFNVGKEANSLDYFNFEKHAKEFLQQLTDQTYKRKKLSTTIQIPEKPTSATEQTQNDYEKYSGESKLDEEDNILLSLDLEWLDEPEIPQKCSAEETLRETQFNAAEYQNDSITAGQATSDILLQNSKRDLNCGGAEIFDKTFKQEHLLLEKLNKKETYSCLESYSQQNPISFESLQHGQQDEAETLTKSPHENVIHNAIKQEQQITNIFKQTLESCLKETRTGEYDDKSGNSSRKDVKKVVEGNLNSVHHHLSNTLILSGQISTETYSQYIEKEEEFPTYPPTHKNKDVLHNLKSWFKNVAPNDMEEDDYFNLATKAAEELINKLNAGKSLEANLSLEKEENLPAQPTDTLEAQLVQKVKFKDLETSPDTSDAQLRPAITNGEENFANLQQSTTNELELEIITQNDSLTFKQTNVSENPTLDLIEMKDLNEELLAKNCLELESQQDANQMQVKESYTANEESKTSNESKDSFRFFNQKDTTEISVLNLTRNLEIEGPDEDLSACSNLEQELYQLETRQCTNQTQVKETYQRYKENKTANETDDCHSLSQKDGLQISSLNYIQCLKIMDIEQDLPANNFLDEQLYHTKQTQVKETYQRYQEIKAIPSTPSMWTPKTSSVNPDEWCEPESYTVISEDTTGRQTVFDSVPKPDSYDLATCETTSAVSGREMDVFNIQQGSSITYNSKQDRKAHQINTESKETITITKEDNSQLSIAVETNSRLNESPAIKQQNETICPSYQLQTEYCCSNNYDSNSYTRTVVQMPTFRQCPCMWDTYAEMLNNFYNGRK